MQKLSHEILLALTYVSQISEPDSIRSHFIESLNALDEAFTFEFVESVPPGISEYLVLPITTLRSSFGYVIMTGRPETLAAEQAVFRNAFKFLAVILENRVQALALELKTESLLKEIKKEKSIVRTILDTLPVGVWVMDEKGMILMVNAAGEKIWAGIRYIGIEQYSEYKAWKPDTGKQIKSEEWAVARTIRTGETFIDEEINIECFDGEHKTILNSAAPLLNDDGRVMGAVCINQDITSRKHVEDALRSSLREKEILLREIHHRVKNNLQVISSLLSLQSGYITDERSKEMFIESMNRVKSMAGIHAKLYESKDFARVDFTGYISGLVSQLINSYAIYPEKITFITDIKDIVLDINNAVPVGLIVNELISNALKHAFPDGRSGEITITADQKDTLATLTVADNGIGFPPHIDFRNSKSLGLLIIVGLVEQILGDISLTREKGTKFTITFSIDS